MKEYYFRGDIKKLIPNGWGFHKLYARNYKAYIKKDLIMYVISKMCVEISNVKRKDQPILIEFILNNKYQPYSFWESKNSKCEIFKNTYFANWILQGGKIVSYRKAMDNKIKFMLDFNKDKNTEYVEDGLHIDFSMVEDILKLDELGELILEERYDNE